jgi:hypothetical protein
MAWAGAESCANIHGVAALDQQATNSRLLANFSHGGTGRSFTLLTCPVSLERSFHLSFRTLQSRRVGTVLVNLEPLPLITSGVLLTELEARLHPAMSTTIVISGFASGNFKNCDLHYWQCKSSGIICVVALSRMTFTIRFEHVMGGPFQMRITKSFFHFIHDVLTHKPL